MTVVIGLGVIFLKRNHQSRTFRKLTHPMNGFERTGSLHIVAQITSDLGLW